jgi:uncharacterized protein YecE (DUF72 family)
MERPSPPAGAGDSERRVWIGCSGYAYKHWRGKFYPEDLPATRWLDHYVRFFPTVELNNTYYTLPGAQTFVAWRDRSPPGFCFAVKASRFITHMKKLKDPAEPLAMLFGRTELLGPKLGPILYQLPPRWRFDAGRLDAFLDALPPRGRHSIEVRDPSWINSSFFAALERRQVAFCIASLPLYESPLCVTAPFVYIRFHGAKTMYYYDYLPDELRWWRDRIVEFAAGGRTVYCYFNNDPEGWAVRNALELTRLVNEVAPLA